MPLATPKVNTWICDKYPIGCKHRWQFSGAALNISPYNLTETDLRREFPSPEYAGLQPGKCPVCYTKGVSSVLGLSAEPTEMSQIIISSDAELEANQVPDVGADGQPIMEDSGEVSYQFDPMTGQINPVAVMHPKLRFLTDAELAALKLQRDQGLDALESVAVREATDAAPDSA